MLVSYLTGSGDTLRYLSIIDSNINGTNGASYVIPTTQFSELDPPSIATSADSLHPNAQGNYILAQGFSNQLQGNTSGIYGELEPQLAQEAAHPAGYDPATMAKMQTAAEQGVPVKIVAYLCLAAFLLAYLFF